MKMYVELRVAGRAGTSRPACEAEWQQI